MLIDKICNIHGETIFSLRKDGRYRCRKCGVVAVQKRREIVKQKAIEYKGGQCLKCGYDRCNASLVFHHRDSLEKDFGIGAKGYTRSWKKILIELDKCDLLCANCHNEEHHCKV